MTMDENTENKEHERNPASRRGFCWRSQLKSGIQVFIPELDDKRFSEPFSLELSFSVDFIGWGVPGVWEGAGGKITSALARFAAVPFDAEIHRATLGFSEQG